MNVRLRIVRVHGQIMGACGVCMVFGKYQHWDADLQAPVCFQCKGAVRNAESALHRTKGIFHESMNEHHHEHENLRAVHRQHLHKLAFGLSGICLSAATLIYLLFLRR